MTALTETFGAGSGVYAVLMLAAFAATDLWRFLGVLVARGVDEGSPMFRAVKMIANALVAGLVAKLVITPAGALADVPVALRLGALAGGVAAYGLTRRSLLAGVLATELVLVGGLVALG